jgi:hypothetical protein
MAYSSDQANLPTPDIKTESTMQCPIFLQAGIPDAPALSSLQVLAQFRPIPGPLLSGQSYRPYPLGEQ